MNLVLRLTIVVTMDNNNLLTGKSSCFDRFTRIRSENVIQPSRTERSLNSISVVGLHSFGEKYVLYTFGYYEVLDHFRSQTHKYA